MSAPLGGKPVYLGCDPEDGPQYATDDQVALASLQVQLALDDLRIC